MKKIVFPAIVFLFSAFLSQGQTLSPTPAPLGKPNTWKEGQLIQPSELMSLLKNEKGNKPLIFNIGQVDDIEGAKNLGAAKETGNVEKLKTALAGLPKSSVVVVYCGCCPFDRCPNIRPAFAALNDLGFTNGRLLNIPTNIKTDWIAKGYPLAPKGR